MCQLSDGDWSHFSSEQKVFQCFRLQRQMHCLVPHYSHTSLSPSLCSGGVISACQSLPAWRVHKRSTLVYIWPLISPQQAFTCKCTEQGWIWGCNISNGWFTSSIFARFIIESTWTERRDRRLFWGEEVEGLKTQGENPEGYWIELCSMWCSIVCLLAG